MSMVSPLKYWILLPIWIQLNELIIPNTDYLYINILQISYHNRYWNKAMYFPNKYQETGIESKYRLSR